MLAGNIPGQTQTIPVAIYFAVEGDMKQASVWVLVILAISLTVLTAVNFGRIPALLQLAEEEESRKAGEQDLTISCQHYSLSPIPPNLLTPKRPKRTDCRHSKATPWFCLETSFTTAFDTLGLLGASGAGKVCSLRCIAGWKPPTQVVSS